jgi:serine/threonine protein kinase
MAPEIIQKKKYDGVAADIFSLGVIMFVLVTGSFPFPQATLDNKYYKLLTSGGQADKNKFWQVTDSASCSDEFKELFAAMVDVNPSKRPSLKQIIAHKWFSAPSFVNQEENIRCNLMKEIDWELHKSKSSLESSENDLSQKE